MGLRWAVQKGGYMGVCREAARRKTATGGRGLVAWQPQQKRQLPKRRAVGAEWIGAGGQAAPNQDAPATLSGAATPIAATKPARVPARVPARLTPWWTP
jgi:hypothetical protein